LEDALRCLHWSWLIERFHFVLKSGCRFEDLQLENAERLKRALGIVAWRLLWLTYEARRRPEQPCSEVLLAGALLLPSSRAPSAASSSYGEPGVKTIWLGFRRLADIAAAWQLMHSMLANPPKHLWVMLR
jgi:hypothetical protein